jgi:hypothetical protein
MLGGRLLRVCPYCYVALSELLPLECKSKPLPSLQVGAVRRVSVNEDFLLSLTTNKKVARKSAVKRRVKRKT